MKNVFIRALFRAQGKLFLKLSMLLLVLGTSVSTAWGQDATTIYLASLKAQSSETSTGSGQVKLTWLDITGKPLAVEVAQQINYLALGDMSFFAKEYIYDGFGETAQLAGGTLIALDGMETPVEIGGTGSQIYMTSFLYFHAEAEPADGSYLAEWAFTDPAITRMSEPMGKIEYTQEWSAEADAWVDVVDVENSIPLRTPCFKVLPNKANSTSYPPMDGGAALAALAASVGSNPNNIYAVFNKYLLANPEATSASLEAVGNAQAELAVTVEVNGDAASLDAADFGTFAFTNNANSEWSYDLSAALASKEVVSAQKTRITIPVTYTYKNTGVGLKNSVMTIRMAGANPSSLNINLSVNALDPARPEAYWFDGKVEKTSGNLADMLNANISTYANPVLKLNKPVSTDLTFSGKNFTLDLNGNTAQAITVSSGNVTVAYSDFGGSAASLSVNGGKAVLNGGTFGTLTIGASGEVEQNGATVTGLATNNGTLTANEGVFNGGLVSSKTLVVNNGTFKGETAITVSGGTAAVNRGAIEGTNCGLKVTAGTATVKKLAAIKGGTYSAQRTGGTLIVECGKFDGPLNGSVDFTSGYFKMNNYGVSTEGKNEMLVSAGVEYNEGYRYFLGTAESAVANGAGVCRIGNVSYAKLEDAIAYANNNPSVQNIVIFMTNNYTLPAGYYTLPANATIVVPMSDSQEKEVNMTAPRVVFNDQRTATPYVTIQPTEFRRLTFASGVNMDVFGQIELTCSQYASNEAYTSQPVGEYGHLVMEEGSHLTLQSGSEVRAWGFITGKGEMDARRGATVREMFQMGDWKGAMTSVKITGMVPSSSPAYGIVGGDDSDKKIFPVTQYFIQNIESPVKYHPGAVLSTSAAVSEGLLGMSVSMAATDIAVVGVSGQHQAIFLMDQMADAENTWVRKWYDAENDIQVYDINSAAHIGSMVLDMGDINLLTYGSVPIRLNSANFDLPLTSNFKIHLLSGSMDFKQNTCLLPGAEVEVDKEATVSVAKDGSDPEHTGALYVYDASEWGKYAYCNEYDGSNLVKGKAYTKVVRYAPSWNGRPTKRAEQTCPPDAAINVHGTFETATGFVYTSESGANIFSNNEDAGTFIFNQSAADAGTRTVYQVEGSGTYRSKTFYPAKLKNGVEDPAFANTADAEAGKAYCYTDDKWNTMSVVEENPCFMVDDYDTYYAKPQEYVALANGMTENADHTYSDKAGTGRLFILMPGCQWWEVEKKDNLYHCTHPQNDTYYYYDEDEYSDTYGQWVEKKFTITWKNWDGTEIKSYDYTDPENPQEIEYNVTYGTMAEFLGTNPTRESSVDYTYNFTGWSPALGKVTSNVTYTATYETQPRMYTIIFCQEGGAEIERQFLTHNEMPACENTPTRIGYTLEWSPAVKAVTGDATYTAVWHKDPPTEYEITFFDYNGTTELKKDTVNVGVMPTPPANPSGKPATSEYTYVFDHWSPALEEVSATSAKSYTAVYREVAKKYTVTFKNEDNSVIESHEYAYGETPVCSKTPTKANTAEFSYSFAWEPQIQTVMADATYNAVFTPTTNKYTVTLRSNLSGACTFTGAGTYDYGTSVSIAATPATGYEFIKWQETGNTNADLGEQTITGDISLTAIVKEEEKEDPQDLNVGIEEVTISEPTDVMNLIITSDGISASGQIINANNITLYGNADFVLSKDFAKRTWYCVAVPWRVDVNGGIYIGNSNTPAVLGTDIDICYYDGSVRAAQGKVSACWVYLKNQNTKKVLEPGRAYMIALLKNSASQVTFRKKVQEPLLTTGTSVQQYPSANDLDAGWNAIANPALFHAFVNAGSADAKAQHYNSADDSYGWFDLDDRKLVVGEPIYVQAPAAKSIVVNNGASYAPARRAQAVSTKYEVSVTKAGASTYADHLSISLNEDKEENKYIIGQDLVKFGVSTKVAQMWVDRYDAKLCVNAVAPEYDATTFPMSIYAPKAGNYTIAVEKEVNTDDYALYLTYNGEAIWNLSEGAYVANMQKGTDANYGLRISAKAPQVVTGVDEAMVDAQGKTAIKVLVNDKVFIIRGEKVYTVEGQLVK